MLTYNGTAIEHVNFNGTAIESGTFNGVTVFEEGQENTVVLRTTQQTIKLTVRTLTGSDVEVWNAGEKVAVLKSLNEGEVLLKDTGKDVTIKGRYIMSLKCIYQQLTSLNVQGCTELQDLVCFGNPLTSLNLQGLSALQYLDCFRCELSSLNVQGCSALQELFCISNDLTSLNLQECTALQRLVCYYNDLTSLNLQGCTALQQLDCRSNKLTSLNVQGLSALQSLNICGNRLTADVFKDMFIHITKTKESGRAILYRNYDYNYKDFTQPAELASAFNAAKAKGWKFYKNDSSERNLL
ncbi:MAG: leucine-rich repeat domain-containing protein [Treponema sp.]|uniref:leucine-rich repeat domain-containing protein n=1 Tax=Treponema sp. TaxID=166 RepID=UPI003FA1C34D